MAKLGGARTGLWPLILISGSYAFAAALALRDNTASDLVLVSSAVLAASLIALTLIDLQTMRLPDIITLPLICGGLLFTWAEEASGIALHGAAAAGGYLSFAGIAWLYRAIRGRAGLGLGDAKLFAAAGSWVGPLGLASVLLWACVLALGAVTLGILRNGSVSFTDRIPFGPFLSFGIWLVWLFGPVT